MTILSVNKTRDFWMGALRPFFAATYWPYFLFIGRMKMKRTNFTTYAAVIAALYAVLTYVQYMLWPESTSLAIQVRVSEALCVLAFFTPAAVPGLTLGCLLFNLTFAGTLPLDWLLGTAATLLAAVGMRLTRNITVKGFPLLGMLMPAAANALLVGWELTYYIGEASFMYNAVFVALGEAIALLIFGTALFYAIRRRKLDEKIFS